jgi:hypothetical protein
MNDGDVLLRQENPWLLGYSALIRMSPLLMSPLLWPFWWPLMWAGEITAGGITADRPEKLHAMRLALGARQSATVIDLAAWRARRAHQASTRRTIDGATSRKK